MIVNSLIKEVESQEEQGDVRDSKGPIPIRTLTTPPHDDFRPLEIEDIPNMEPINFNLAFTDPWSLLILHIHDFLHRGHITHPKPLYQWNTMINIIDTLGIGGTKTPFLVFS